MAEVIERKIIVDIRENAENSSQFRISIDIPCSRATSLSQLKNISQSNMELVSIDNINPGRNMGRNTMM